MNQEQLKTWIEDNLDWYECSEDYSEPGYSKDEGKELIFFAIGMELMKISWNRLKITSWLSGVMNGISAATVESL